MLYEDCVRMFWAANNRKPDQKLFKLWSFFIVLLLAFYIIGSAEVRQLTQWSNNILKDPGSFCCSALPFSDCCWLWFSSLSSQGRAWLLQQHIICSPSYFTRQKGMLFLIHNLFYHGGKPVIEGPQPKADFAPCLIGQICITCPHLNWSLARGINYLVWAKLDNLDSPFWDNRNLFP